MSNSSASGILVQKPLPEIKFSRRERPRKVGLQYIHSTKRYTYRYVQAEFKDSELFADFADKYQNVYHVNSNQATYSFEAPSLDDFYDTLRLFGKGMINLIPTTSVKAQRSALGIIGIEGHGNYLPCYAKREYLHLVKVPQNTSPGIHYRKMGMRFKRHAIHTAVIDAAKVLEQIRSTGTTDLYRPAALGGRGKLMSFEGGSDKLTGSRTQGRLVLMVDLCVHLIGSLCTHPYFALQRNFDKSNGGVMLGMDIVRHGWKRFFQKLEGEYTYYCIDFSKFDTSVPAEVLRLAFSIVKRKFRDTDQGYWDFVEKNLIETLIVLPEGDIYKKKKGVASGDPWTSLIGSYANWIVLDVIFREAGFQPKIWVFGDDSVVAIPRESKLGIPQLSALARSMFGMNISMEKSYKTDILYAPDANDLVRTGSVSFLSLYCLRENYLPIRLHSDSTMLLRHPESSDITVTAEYERAVGNYAIAFNNPQSEELLTGYTMFLEKAGYSGMTYTEFIKLDIFKVLGIGFRDTLIGLKRPPTIAELVDLYTSVKTA